MEPGVVFRNRARSPWRYLWLPLMAAWGAGFIWLPIQLYVGIALLVASTALAIGYHRHFGQKKISEHGKLHKSGDRLLIVDLQGAAELEIDARRIVGGFYNDHDRVVLELDDKTEYLIGAIDRAEAENIMTTAGVSADRRALRVPIASPLGRYDGGAMMGCMALFLAIIVAVGMYAADSPWIVAAFAVIALIVRLLQRGEAVVGTDGIVLTRAFWGKRFVSFGDITEIQTRYRRLEVHTRNGERHLVSARWTDAFTPEVSQRDDQWGNRALHYRLEQATARRQLDSQGITLEKLERRGRALDTWHAELKRLGSAVGGYRDPATTVQSLAAVVADPAEIAERRMGAALALAETGPQARERVAAVANACAEPNLAKALKAASEQRIDGEAIEEALVRHSRDRDTGLRFGFVDETNPDAWTDEHEAELEAAEEPTVRREPIP